MRVAIRNLSSGSPTHPRFCDAIINRGNVQLEVKIGKNKFVTIPWKDVIRQVNAAIKQALGE